MPVNERLVKDEERTAHSQGRGDIRRSIWAVYQDSGMSGALFGANGEGRRPFLSALVLIVWLVVGGNVSNVISIHHDAPDYGFEKPIIWEASSALALIAFVWIPWLALRSAPFHGRPVWRTIFVHLSALVLFSVAHVSGFVLLRNIVYLAMGETYGIAPLTNEFFYEFRKDAISYLTIVALFWAFERFLGSKPQQPVVSVGVASIDIRDGAKLDRVRVDDVLAVTSADNYVEYVMADGRRLITRKSLSSAEEELTAHGFIRTHRSWLVNATRMTGLKPEGSGDYTIELGTLNVPLSRRFPDALSRLRAGPR